MFVYVVELHNWHNRLMINKHARANTHTPIHREGERERERETVRMKRSIDQFRISLSPTHILLKKFVVMVIVVGGYPRHIVFRTLSRE